MCLSIDVYSSARASQTCVRFLDFLKKTNRKGKKFIMNAEECCGSVYSPLTERRVFKKKFCSFVCAGVNRTCPESRLGWNIIGWPRTNGNKVSGTFFLFRMEETIGIPCQRTVISHVYFETRFEDASVRESTVASRMIR